MACAANGDVFCRECAVSNLLAQRKEIVRLEKDGERRRTDEVDAGRREDEEARERAVRDFEAVQMGLEGRAGERFVVGGRKGRKESVVVAVREEVGGEEVDVAVRGTGGKRKFEIDEDELLRIARDERTKTKKVLDEEKVGDKTQPLPSYIRFLGADGIT